ncbi:MAG: stage V sporulation protein AB [Lachnospiraceae bacterium]|nr:stage V sporulation protein AB [Lachnospiraceae bacterium]
MFSKWIFLAVLGISSGLVVSGGVFTVLLAVGLIPRFAGKMHIARHVFVLEEMVVFGTLVGNFLSVFSDYGRLGEWILSRQLFGQGTTNGIWHFISTILLILFGFFSGIFVGCLALAIAEMLDTIPIFSRRVGFRHGLGISILAVAIGKVLGSLIYFTQEFFLYSG